MERKMVLRVAGESFLVLAAVWLALVLPLAAWPTAALAEWGPGQIAVEGELTNLAGEPIDGPANLQFFIYSSPDALNAVWNETHKAVPLADGRFQIVLGDAVPLDNPPLFESYADLWIGLSVNGGGELPRVPLTAIGYSMQAKHAEVCEELAAPPDDLACSGCVADTEVSFNYAGSDSKGGPALDLSCPACVAETEVSFNYAGSDGKAGAALDLNCQGCVSGTDVQDASIELSDLAQSGCAAGNVIKRNGGGTAWACEKDDNTTYGAGPGLKLNGTTFSADQAAIESWAKGVCYDSQQELDPLYVGEGQANAITGVMVNDGAISDAKIQSVAWGKLTNVPAGFADGTDADSGGDITEVKAGTGLKGGGASGSVAVEADKVVLDSWAKNACYDTPQELTATLDGTYVNVGEPNSISSAMIIDNTVSGPDVADGTIGAADIADGSVGAAEIADGSVGAVEIADGSVGAAEIADGSVGAAEIADGSVGTAEIADNTVSSSDILNGTIVDADISGSANIAFSKLSGVAASSHTHPASQITAGTFQSGTYELNTSSTLNVNGHLLLTACPSGYTLRGANLCVSNVFRPAATFYGAQADCFDEGAHVCTYAEIYHAWASGKKPAIINGDWIGDVVGDDQILCVNSYTNQANFEGNCDKNDSRQYICCMRGGSR